MGKLILWKYFWSLTVVCGLSPVLSNKLWFNYFITPTSVQTLHTTKCLVKKFAFSDKGVINI